MRTLTSNTLRFWQPGVWFLACLPLLAKCCLILQDQANILKKAKKKKNLRSYENQTLVRKNGLKKYHPENVCSAVLCLAPKPRKFITEAREGLKLPRLVIHLTSTMVHFPQKNLSEKDSLGTCYQELQEKKIRI